LVSIEASFIRRERRAEPARQRPRLVFATQRHPHRNHFGYVLPFSM
jgi:hypothetical protein